MVFNVYMKPQVFSKIDGKIPCYKIRDIKCKTHIFMHTSVVCIALYAHQPHTRTSYHTDHSHYVDTNHTHISYMCVCTSVTYISHMCVHVVHTRPSKICVHCIKQTASVCMCLSYSTPVSHISLIIALG